MSFKPHPKFDTVGRSLVTLFRWLFDKPDTGRKGGHPWGVPSQKQPKIPPLLRRNGT